jgi:hypothetical protein
MPPSHTSTVKVNAACSSETSVSAYKITWCHNPEDHTSNLEHGSNAFLRNVGIILQDYSVSKPRRPHFNFENEGSMLLQNVGIRPQDYTVSQSWRPECQHNTLFLSKLQKWGETKSFGTAVSKGSVVSVRDDTWELLIARENRSARRKACPSVTLSTTNPTLTNLGLNRANAVTSLLLTI